jgi:hypothetical protein
LLINIKIMKKFMAACCIPFFALGACTKDTGNSGSLSEGVITRADFGACICCGGWFIDIGQNSYRFYTIPESSHIDLTKETFPLYVTVGWKKSENQCDGLEIAIDYIRKK